jgi:subtilase family serine protease
MWSIPLCYCNDGYNNRKVRQTQLQYYINYTMVGATPHSVINIILKLCLTDFFLFL